MKLKVIEKITLAQAILGVSIVFTLFFMGTIQTAHAQIGSGWTQIYPSKQYNSGMPQSERYSISNNVEHFWTYTNDIDEFPGQDSGPRSEWRVFNDYTNGTHQFQADLNPENGTSSYTCFQIFGSISQATSIQLQMRSNNGTLKRYDSEVLATGCWGIYTRVNVIHDADAGQIEVWINGSQISTYADGGVVNHYFKYGVYDTPSATYYVGDYWRGASFFTGGTSSGGNPDFSISASPSSQTVTAGNSTSYTTTIDSTNGFNSSVSLSVSGLPSNSSADFNPSSVTGSGNSTLTVNTTTTTPAGTYTLTITGTSGSLTHTATVSLTVNPAPDFSISASPSSQAVTAGSGTSYTATINALNGFNSSVSLSASGLPLGASGTFNPTPVTGSGSSTLTVTTSASTAAGTYTLTITGTSGSLTHTTTASLTVNAPALPSGWTDADIGSVGLSGSASYNNGIFTISGSGADIWNAGDQFNYTYQSISGDNTIIARVVSENGSAPYAKAGVMIRETLATNSVEASVLLTPTNGVAMEIRPTTGAASINVTGWVKGPMPVQWVKLVRSGGTFTASYSANGSTWTQFASTNVTMATSATAGLAVTSHDNTSLNTATFNNVSITAPAPDFSLSASPSSLTIVQGNNGISTITVNPINGYTGTVSLSASGLPSGVTASFNPSSATTSSTLTLTASSTATTGTVTVTVTGTDGTLTHTTVINLTVNAGGNKFTGVFQLQNEASGLVLNNQGSLTNGSTITQWNSVSSSNLDWTFIATSNGYYQINSCKSGKDAVVQSASTAQGAGIIQWQFGAAGNDQWEPVANSDGSYTFYNLHSGLVLEDPAFSTNKTTQMDQWGANSGSNQKWILLQQ